MQSLNVLRTWNTPTEFVLSNSDFTEFRGHSNAAQEMSLLLNDVQRRYVPPHSDPNVVYPVYTHRYYGFLKIPIL